MTESKPSGGNRPTLRLLPLLFAVVAAILPPPSAHSAVLPLGDEQEAWSDMLLPSANGMFETVSRTLTLGTGSTAAPTDLEFGSAFGPSNPGWHYGTTGTLGGTFSTALGISRLHVSSAGAVTDSDSIVHVSFQGGAAGSLGTDYGINTGRDLLRGVVTEVLLDAAGEDTLDILFRITSGDLQDLPNKQTPLSKFAPGNLALIRIVAPNLPNDWNSNFNFAATSMHVFGLVPEPGTATLAAALIALTACVRRR
jgi:hypothetical protein